MRFSTPQHKHYCGSDLHARPLYLCLLEQAGTVLVHKHVAAPPANFLRVLAPYRAARVVAGECIFTGYGLSALCAQAGSACVRGHALYRKALHGGKAKNEKLESPKIAVLLGGGRLPLAYVSPPELRAPRDRLRRRCPLRRKRAEVLAPMQNTTSPYTLPAMGKTLAYQANREGVEAHFPEPSVRKTSELEVALLDHDDQLWSAVALSSTRTAKGPAAQSFSRLQSGPGVGQILALGSRYELQDLSRFPRVQDCGSYGRLVTCAKESAGNRHGLSGQKMGTPQRKGACSAAAGLCLRQHQPGKEDCAKLEHKQGNGKALPVRAHQLARAVYPRRTREQAVALPRFVTA